MLTTLAELHNVVRITWHPLPEASCIFTSRQYRFCDLTLSQFLSAILPSSVTWTEDESKQLGFGVPFIEVASVHSTSASLSGVDKALSASHSSWLSLKCRSSIMPSFGLNWWRDTGLAFPSCFFDFFYWALLCSRQLVHPQQYTCWILLSITIAITSAKAQKKVFNQKLLTLL